jgi:hypothetical protein
MKRPKTPDLDRLISEMGEFEPNCLGEPFDPDSTGELEDALKQAERRFAEMKAERDEANELAGKLSEEIESYGALLDDGAKRLTMEYNGDVWVFNDGTISERYDELLISNRDLVKKWNRFVGEYNTAIAPKC